MRNTWSVITAQNSPSGSASGRDVRYSVDDVAGPVVTDEAGQAPVELVVAQRCR